eukprot:TRINITY_DN6811_c0_g1_i7.p1 TRINITY_DN6811_c0_g1~~TRINITY_DN6811_c0_g1_i7.p1  ORF type:complete len:762 (-),score=165.71 TRINITY_DN6811_c0_g1_i7:308-2593(-)
MGLSLQYLQDPFSYIMIFVAIALGGIFAIVLVALVGQVKVGKVVQNKKKNDTESALLDNGKDDTEEKVADIQQAITQGAKSFLITEYSVCIAFMAAFAIIIFVLLGSQRKFTGNSLKTAIFSTISFILGFLTSMVSGYIGMSIATYANARTTLEARKGLGPAFVVAYEAGSVMGFALTSLGLLVLFLAIIIYHLVSGWTEWSFIYEAIAGYGLGGSSMALFGRVGGGIYTKAADVGADLVGKVEKDIPEDDPRNPGVIADNVGDNVGDIAGMGADLFGSFAEATCAALVVVSVSDIGLSKDFLGMNYPLFISALGIYVGFITTLIAMLAPPKNLNTIERALKLQLVIASVIITPLIIIVSLFTLPQQFQLNGQIIKNWYMAICVLVGLWGGLIIGLFTEYFTSNSYVPVKEVAESCRTGAATNIIFGLAWGYKSAIIPAVVVAVDIYIAFSLAGMFGISCAALGMLSILATCLAIDAYGPIADNAGGIAEMAEMGAEIRQKTDALDAAGNTTAAIGKGFAIGSAALVSLALFGAFVTRVKLQTVNILTPEVFFGLLLGAMLPYWFSAMTMKSVGKAALAMVEEVRRQFREIPGLMEGTNKPDYKKCVEISTQASLREMVPPGILVMGTPLIMGILFGTHTLAGVLAGALVSGFQMANSMSNTGGAWDNAKKYVEAGATDQARALGGKGSDIHKVAVVGDTVGDPLKDTSGPALNILIKLMAVESLVFAPFFYCLIFERWKWNHWLYFKQLNICFGEIIYFD